MNVHRADTAQGHLAVIAQISPTSIPRIVARLARRSQPIGSFPQAGRRIPEYQLEQIGDVIEVPHRISYEIKSNQINGLAVVHAVRTALGNQP